MPHRYTYIKDFSRALVIFGENDQAEGQIWHVSNASAVMNRKFLSIVYEMEGFKPKIKAMPKILLKLCSYFHFRAKEILNVFIKMKNCLSSTTGNLLNMLAIIRRHIRLTFQEPLTGLKGSMETKVRLALKNHDFDGFGPLL